MLPCHPKYCLRYPALLAVVLMSTLTGRAAAGEILQGPIPAQVVRIIDGDTIVVRARIWLGQDIETNVRLDGIDTPELRGRCPAETKLAHQAKAFLEAKTAEGLVVLQQVQYGKFAGRVVSKVTLPDGEDMGRALVSGGLARTYRGGKRQSWCGPS